MNGMYDYVDWVASLVRGASFDEAYATIAALFADANMHSENKQLAAQFGERGDADDSLYDLMPSYHQKIDWDTDVILEVAIEVTDGRFPDLHNALVKL